MRTYYDIRLSDRSITKRELAGEAVVKAGRYFIAKTLLELGAATVDPLSPANPLIFSAGPFAGTSVPFGTTTMPDGVRNGNRSASATGSSPITQPGSILQLARAATAIYPGARRGTRPLRIRFQRRRSR